MRTLLICFNGIFSQPHRRIFKVRFFYVHIGNSTNNKIIFK